MLGNAKYKVEARAEVIMCVGERIKGGIRGAEREGKLLKRDDDASANAEIHIECATHGKKQTKKKMLYLILWNKLIFVASEVFVLVNAVHASKCFWICHVLTQSFKVHQG